MPTVAITPRELERRISAGDELVLLDVRESGELAICRIADSVHIPMGDIGRRAGELEREAEIVCICHHGVRSANVAAALTSMGFEHTLNLSGGIDRWAREVDTRMARY
jgi:rhodanese-related sulfurtransferase